MGQGCCEDWCSDVCCVECKLSKMRRKIILALFITIMLGIGSYIVVDYYMSTMITATPILPPPPPDASIEVAGVVKVQINEDNSWETILKLVSTILVTYAGIRLINKKIT